MVRLKGRHLLCELVYPDGSHKKPVDDADVYREIMNELRILHGEWAVATSLRMPGMKVKYLNPDTNIVLVSTKRGLHKWIQSAMAFVKKIGKESVMMRTLHVGGSIRSCLKFLMRYHKTQIPLMLQKCQTDEERQKLKAALDVSCQATMTKVYGGFRERRPEDKTSKKLDSKGKGKWSKQAGEKGKTSTQATEEEKTTKQEEGES